MNRPIEIAIKIDSLPDSKKLLELVEFLKNKLEEVNTNEENSSKIKDTADKSTPSVKKETEVNTMSEDTFDTKLEDDKSVMNKNGIKLGEFAQEYDKITKFARYMKSQQELMTNPLFWELVDKHLNQKLVDMHLNRSNRKSNETMAFKKMHSDDLYKFIKFTQDIKNNGEFWKLFEKNPEKLKNELKNSIIN